MKIKNITILKTFVVAFCFLAPALISAANEASGTIFTLPVNNATLDRSDDNMNVSMTLDLNRFKIKGKKAILFTPYIVNGKDSLSLEPVGVYSHNRWIQYQRYGYMLGGDKATSIKYNDHLSAMNYTATVPYLDWMNGAHLAVKGETFTCCNNLIAQDILDLDAEYNQPEYVPDEFVFQPLTEVLAREDVVKTRELSGRAYIDYPVNQTIIYPDYRNNRFELNKIIGTIDSVRNDKDVTVNLIHISGTASPEGGYENNVRLAKGRTEALKNYVQNLYNFPYGFITTSYEPVDWAGLHDFLVNGPVGPAYNNIRYVDINQVLPNRYSIIAIVDGNIEPYQRNLEIKKRYPKEYQWLLENVYPALRHSDYRIEYSIKQYTSVEEIAEVIKTEPGKLTLKEMMQLANTYEPGSEGYNAVFEVAVRMYPDEPIVNLNIANEALKRGDLAKASLYLPKAGNSPQALLARANYAFLQGDFKQAGEFYREAARFLPEAMDAYKKFQSAGYDRR